MALLRRESGEQRPISPELGMLMGVTERATENGLTALYRSLGFNVLDEEDSRRVMAGQANTQQAPAYEAAPLVAVPAPGLAEVATESVPTAGLEQPVVPGVTPLPGFGGIEKFQDVVEPYDWDQMAKETPRDGFDLAA
jgi:hypothetical protein